MFDGNITNESFAPHIFRDPRVLAFMQNFFFRAEAGIRAATVTGVQTCALPISLVPRLSDVDVPSLLNEVLGVMSRRAEERQQKISVELSPRVKRHVVDRDL